MKIYGLKKACSETKFLDKINRPMVVSLFWQSKYEGEYTITTVYDTQPVELSNWRRFFTTERPMTQKQIKGALENDIVAWIAEQM